MYEEPVQKRRLATVTSPSTTSSQKTLITKEPVSATSGLSSTTQCDFCLSEAEFFAFFQGVYDGQAFFNRSLPEINVHECIAQSDDLKNLFTGEL